MKYIKLYEAYNNDDINELNESIKDIMVYLEDEGFNISIYFENNLQSSSFKIEYDVNDLLILITKSNKLSIYGEEVDLSDRKIYDSKNKMQIEEGKTFNLADVRERVLMLEDLIGNDKVVLYRSSMTPNTGSNYHNLAISLGLRRADDVFTNKFPEIDGQCDYLIIKYTKK